MRCLLRWMGLAVLGASLVFSPLAIPAQNRSRDPAEVKSSLQALNQLQEAFAALADQLEPAVVTVYSTRPARAAREGRSEELRGLFPLGKGTPRRSTGTGSGVIISADGWVLTNDHVIDGAGKVMVKLNDGRELAGVARRDPRSDLALIKISDSKPFPYARLGDSDTLRIGHWAIAIGSPYRYEGSFSVGVISSLQRRQEIFDPQSPDGGRFYPSMIQTDAAINPGNSGGPLCNLDGEVIGINTAIESDGGGSVGIGFAIPINSAKFVIKQLMEKGRVSYGYLGVDPTTVTPRLAAALKVEEGALVRRDPPAKTPAGRAGLQAGDVITGIDSQPVRSELDFRTLVAQTPPGTTVKLTVVRNGKPRALTATLEEAPNTAPEAPRAPARTSRLGIEVQPLTEKLAKAAGVSAKTAGVVIKSIDANSGAADVDDLFEGVIIQRVNDTETPTVTAFLAATANLKPGDDVRLYYQYSTPYGLERKFTVVRVD